MRGAPEACSGAGPAGGEHPGANARAAAATAAALAACLIGCRRLRQRDRFEVQPAARGVDEQHRAGGIQ